MRIAYVAYWDLDAGDGVAKKVAAQLACWRAAGHEAEPFAVRPSGIASRLRATKEMVRNVERFAPDLVYVRYDLFVPPAGKLARIAPLVVELNGNDRAETRRRGALATVANELSRRLLLRRAAGIVCVTHELARAVAPLGRRTAVIANGCDPGRVAWTPAPPRNGRPHALFVGSPGMAWHGVDVLVGLARALPGVQFDVVGAEAPDLENVRPHGVLTEAGYADLLARADVAFGSLALERAGLSEGSPLKVREYLLAGIPTVIGFRDTDFPDEPWFLLRSVDAREVAAFVERVRGKRVDRDEVAHLFVDAKERERLAFFESVTAS